MMDLASLNYVLSAKSCAFEIANSGAIEVNLRRAIRPSQESQPNSRRHLL